jgi:hypothetical protein
MRLRIWLVLLSALLWACGASVVHSGVNQWTPIGPQARRIFTLAIDPVTPATLYAATGSGVFKSTNGGDSWSAVNTGLPGGAVSVLAIDPAMPATLYAGTYTAGVFKSTDGGASWSAINTGLTSLAIQVLNMNPPTLYAGTDGGGVFAITFLDELRFCCKDFNGDGKADILWRNTSTGDVAGWLMNGVTVKQGAGIYAGVPLAWQIVGVGDLDGDGKADLVWRNTSTGDVAGWLMNGVTVKQGAGIYAGVPLAWQIQ